MKLKKILSSVLVTVMLFASIITVIPPVESDAAYVSVGSTAGTLTQEQIVSLVTKGIKEYSFDSAREMFEEELAAGYLVGTKLADAYSLYVNRYTGYVYYINEITGEILTSNPWYVDGTLDTLVKDRLTSQLVVSFIETSSAVTTSTEYTSAKHSAAYSQISVSPIYNGFRVSYSIGDTSDRVLLPAGMLASTFEEKIMMPMISAFLSALESYEYVADAKKDPAAEADKVAFGTGIYDRFVNYSYSALGFKKKKDKENFLAGIADMITGYEMDLVTLKQMVTDRETDISSFLFDYFAKWNEMYSKVLNADLGTDYRTTDQYETMYEAFQASNMILANVYLVKDPVGRLARLDGFWEKYNTTNSAAAKKQILEKNIQPLIAEIDKLFQEFPITGHWEKDGKVLKVWEDGATAVIGESIYVLKDNSTSEPFEKLYANKAKNYSNMIKQFVPTYTVTNMISDEKDAGCEMPVTPKAVFKVALEYTLETDGTLKVELPANSISFDETKYTLTKIDVLDMFGATRTDATEETYAFFPDGSGMVSRFADYSAVSLNRPLYGTDYAYSDLKADFNYLEQVSVPVYGMVSGNTGFVSIIEEGAALAEINLTTSRQHKFASTFISVKPYPQDKFDLTETTSVSTDVTSYSKTAETRYAGSYTMKIAMLSNNEDAKTATALYNTANSSNYACYAASYVGMAACYRDYLIAKGEITALAEATEDLPLYIEALGSMEYIKKILSFPINSALALTEFEDVVTMYNELSSCVETLMQKAQDKDAAAAETEDLNEKVNCEEEAAEYRRLASELADFSGISNINFKLTGFANNGLNYNYPTRVKWERVCGGKSGFRDLVAVATDKNFGVYPDFDFMYIVNNEMFDGVGTNGYVARQIDNRYASKKIYTPTIGMYFPGFSGVVASDVIPELFAKFESRYADYDWKYLSLSTMGSTLNSDFDERDSINREESLSYVTSVFESAKSKGYSIMVDKGNAYTYKYVDHIIDLDTDSSHHIYCTYTVPFVGMVLHGYMNYSGSPINYSGASDYDILRSIESGASLLYILCCRNTSFMKEYGYTNSYYSVDYNNWYTDILLNYKELNEAIGDLQNYVISDHRVITAEKVINSKHAKENYDAVRSEFLGMIRTQLNDAANDAYEAMSKDNPNGYTGVNFVTVDAANEFDLVASLTAQFESIVNTEADDSFAADIMAIVDEVKLLRGHNANNGMPVMVGEVSDYEKNTKYDFYTDSDAYDKDYDVTDNTVLNSNVVSVTYTSISDPTKQVTFLLNFNIYAVNVMVDGEIIPLDRYEYVRI